MGIFKKLMHRWLFTYDMDLMLDDEYAKKPWRKYKNDAGYDLHVHRSTTIPPHESINVPTGVHIKSTGVPVWLMLTGRSSTLIKHGIVVDSGVIDDGYVGEMFIKVYNTTEKPVCLYPGMRIGQIIAIPLTWCNFKLVKEFKLLTHERGTNGFGSTGE